MKISLLFIIVIYCPTIFTKTTWGKGHTWVQTWYKRLKLKLNKVTNLITQVSYNIVSEWREFGQLIEISERRKHRVFANTKCVYFWRALPRPNHTTYLMKQKVLKPGWHFSYQCLNSPSHARHSSFWVYFV